MSRLYCSFCGKSQDEVRKLIAGPTVFICNECVDLCADICATEHPLVDKTLMGEAEYASWVIAERPPNPVETLADALLQELERRGYTLAPAGFT